MYDAHKADHERLLDEIRDMMDDYEDGEFVQRRAARATAAGVVWRSISAATTRGCTGGSIE